MGFNEFNAPEDVTPGARSKWAKIAQQILLETGNPDLAKRKATANVRSTRSFPKNA